MDHAVSGADRRPIALGRVPVRALAPRSLESEADGEGRAVALDGAALLLLGLWWGLARDVLVPLLPVLAGWLTVALSTVALLAVLTVLFPRTGGDEP